MKKNKIMAITLIFVTIIIGGVAMYNVFNPNNRSRYRIFEVDGNFYYRNHFFARLYDGAKVRVEFNDGLALINPSIISWGSFVQQGFGIFKYIDTKGRVVLRPDVYFAHAFSEGLAAVMPHEGGPWGYINIYGEMVIEPQFRRASMFENGVASVYFENDNGGRWVLINQSGEHLQYLEGPLDWRSQTQLRP